MKQGYFITGTSTGVGKTFATATLTRRARALGQRVFAFKPIETGCEDGHLGSDQRELVAAAGGWQTGALAGVYQFKPPVAPSVAAAAANVEISLSTILNTLNVGAEDADLTLIEGAGGWRVPISDTLDMSGLARACGLSVLVVATAVLGTINHSLLTVEAVERDGQLVAALILSQHPDDDPELAASNAEQLRTRWSGSVIVLGSDPTVLDQLVSSL